MPPETNVFMFRWALLVLVITLPLLAYSVFIALPTGNPVGQNTGFHGFTYMA